MDKSILSQLKEAFSGVLPQHFYTVGDNIVKWIAKQKNIEMAIVVLEFSKFMNQYRVQGDIIFKENGVPSKLEGFIDTLLIDDSFPEYFKESIRMGNVGKVKFSEEDLNNLFAERIIPSEPMISWAELVKQQGNEFTLTDRGFYTLVKSASRIVKYGFIESVPADIYNKVYPFKAQSIKL